MSTDDEQLDLFDNNNCLSCPLNVGSGRCQGAASPFSETWKRQYCVIDFFRSYSPSSPSSHEVIL